MVRSSYHVLSALLAGLLLSNCSPVVAQQKSAYEMLPATTQAVVMIPDGKQLLDNWERTELARLATDSAVAPFFEEQRQEIEKRFIEAGWRLNVRPNDVRQFLTGQIAVAWMSVDNLRKPFAMTMVADVENDAAANAQLLKQIDTELAARGADKARVRHEGIEIAKYTLPARAGERLAQYTFYSVVDGFFLATDDVDLIKNLISSVQGKAVAGTPLPQDQDFAACLKKIRRNPSNDIEYFARPLGFAQVLRSIGGQRSKNGPDVMAILKSQGFGAIKSVAGSLSFGGQKLDILHQGFVLADFPLPLSAAVLDFPNKATREIPNFIGDKISKILVTNWNANKAFWKTKGLVDEFASTPGLFDEVINGFKMDPNGPQIDLKTEVLPRFTNDIVSVSDSSEGEATVNSRRNLIALKVNDAAGMADVVNRAMFNDPDAERVEFQGHEIWKVVHQESEAIDDFGDFDDFDDEPEDAQGAAPEKLLNDWAITVFGEYVIFSSHIGMIQEAITQAKTSQTSPLTQQADYQRVTEAVQNVFGPDEACAWNVVRTDRAYRIQYELFRAGKLSQSQSMLATLLDKLLQKGSEIRGPEQRVQGKSLPPFTEIAKFLQPSSMMVRTVDDGWEFGSIMLAAPAPGEGGPGLSNRRDVDTAHLTNIRAAETR